MTNLQCTHSSIYNYIKKYKYADDSTWLCDHVSRGACKESFDFINFYSLQWCDLDGMTLATILISILIIIAIFKYTSMAVEEYIAEGIQQISDALKFSESLAAITLLAFANGAGDVITALVSSGSEGGISYNIGALLGAGLFVCSAVVAICVIQSEKPMVFDKSIIYRDVLMYIVSVLFVIFCGWYGSIEIWTAIGLLALYIILVLIVVVQDKMAAKQEEGKEPLNELEANRASINPMKESEVKDTEENEEKPEEEEKEPAKKSAEIKFEKEDKKELTANLGNLMLAFGQQKESTDKGLSTNDDFANMIANFVNISSSAEKLRVKLEYLKARKKQEKVSILEHISRIIGYPFEFMLYITALPAEHDHYSKRRTLIYPIPGMLFLTWIVMNTFSLKWLIIGCSLGVFLEVIFFFLLKDKEEKERPSWYIWGVVLSVISGLAWTYVLVGVLIDLLNAVGVILNINNTYLGLTILAIGNALPDALTTIALAKQGLGVMALSGGYAGQLFGLLVGFGLSMLKVTLAKGSQDFDLFKASQFKENMLEIFVIGVILLVLLCTFLFAIINRFTMTKSFGYFIFAVYGVFLILSTVVAVQKALEH